MLIPNIFGLKVGLEFEISSNRVIKEVESRCKNYLNDRGMFFVHDQSVPVTKTELNFAKPFQIYLKDIISEENLRRRKLRALLSDIFHENKKGRHYKQEGGHVHVNINWFFVKRVWGSALFFKLCLTRFLPPPTTCCRKKIRKNYTADLSTATASSSVVEKSYDVTGIIMLTLKKVLLSSVASQLTSLFSPNSELHGLFTSLFIKSSLWPDFSLKNFNLSITLTGYR